MGARELPAPGRRSATELERTRPFAGLRVGTGIHLEPKTVALLLTLRRGGADVVATGNLNTTQQAASTTCRRTASTWSAARRATPSSTTASCARFWPRAQTSCSTTAATSSSASSRRPTTACAAGRRRRRRAGCASSRSATAGPAGPGDQRQPDQAVRREPARRRAERARVLPPDHEQVDQRTPRHRLRLRRLRQGRRRELPQRLCRRLGRRARPGRTAGGDARRVPRARARRGAAHRPTS